MEGNQAEGIVNPYISGIMVDEVIQAGNYDLLPKLIACLVGMKWSILHP